MTSGTLLETRSSEPYTLLRTRMPNGSMEFNRVSSERGMRLTGIMVDTYGPVGKQYMLGSSAYLRAIRLESDNGFECSYGDISERAQRWGVPFNEYVSQVVIYQQDMSGFDALTGLEFMTNKGTHSPMYGGRDVDRAGRPMNRTVIAFAGLQLIELGGKTVQWDSPYGSDHYSTILQLSFAFGRSPWLAFAPGDAVEVWVSGGWVDGIYKHHAGAFPGKEQKPHAVEYSMDDMDIDDFVASDQIRLKT